mmetsp:Transcript_27248/g.56632  ORF Transcript_27248/g.56632 Transcript_27248/m.56632 type:complete len:119 (-) Transcript_27248:376-732(-)
MSGENESAYYSPLGFWQGKRPRIIPVGYAGYVPGMQEMFGTPWKVVPSLNDACHSVQSNRTGLCSLFDRRPSQTSPRNLSNCRSHPNPDLLPPVSPELVRFWTSGREKILKTNQPWAS